MANENLDPDAIALYQRLRSLHSALVATKNEIEFVLQQIRAKELLPNADGSPPAELCVVDDMIAGDPENRLSTIKWSRAARSIAATLALQAATQADIAPGVTIETAILANAGS